MKTIMYMAMTVNGYIAQENNQTPWSDPIWNGYYALIKEKGNIILGRRTYEIMTNAQEFDLLGNPCTVVLTHNLSFSPKENVSFVNFPKDALALLEKKGFTEAILGGGSGVNASFLRDNLIDELWLDIDAKIFGRGIKLFSDIDLIVSLKLLELQKLEDDVIRVKYLLARDSAPDISKK